MKLLSIIIPTYNAEKFLDKGLTSMILSQEWMEQLEVIVVNDGSPDNSVAVAQKYVDRYPGTFCILNKENGGHGSGINAGTKAAKGKYFKVVDADDWVNTEALEKTMELLSNGDYDALVQSYCTYDISTEPAAIVHWSVKNPDPEGHPDAVYNLAELMPAWDSLFMSLSFHGLIYNTEFYRSQNYDLVEKVFYEDQEYCTIPLCRAKRIGLSPEEVYVYRIGDVNQSVSTQSMIKRLPHFMAVLQKELEFESRLDQCPEGAEDYYYRKLGKFLSDIYRIMLIRSEDKKCFRKDAKKLTADLKVNHPKLYRAVKKRYFVFRLLNRLHMSDATYEKKVVGTLNKRRSS